MMYRIVIPSLILIACAKGAPVGMRQENVPSPITSATLPGPDVEPTGSTGATGATPTSQEPTPTSNPQAPKLDVGSQGTGMLGDTSTTGPVYPGGEIGGESTGSSTSSGSSGTTGTSGGMSLNEPQPMVGLYQNCLATNECDPELTDGCFTVTNERLQIVDGYCTLICADVVECEQASDVSGMQACVLINNVKMCALPCRDDLACPSGMFCKELAGSGYYCI